MRLSKRTKRLLIVVTFVPTLYGLNYLVTPEIVGVAKLEMNCRPRSNLKFNPEAWKQTPSDGRYNLVDDLLAADAAINLDENQLDLILGNPDFITDKEGDKLRFYFLGDQRMYPSKSIWFPGFFANQDRWMLEIRIRNGKSKSARVFFT